MIKINIYFQDLNQDAQDEIWRKIQNELISNGVLERNEDETEEEFNTRLYEAVEGYIYCRNFANEFVI